MRLAVLVDYHSNMPHSNPHISSRRLWESLEQYARFGATREGGVSRPVFSEADHQARQRLVEDCRSFGLDVRIDAAANVIATRAGRAARLPAIMIGSHLDSVPDGGRYDGALGVLSALEVMRTLVEHDAPARHPVSLISLTGEEATSFGTSTFGSRALAGRLLDVAANILPDGRTVREALRAIGGDWDRLPSARAELGSMACFLEVHIEQGTRLEAANQALAVVSSVCGIYRQRITFHGEAGHAGTTAMGARHDALRAAARAVLAIGELPARVAADDPSATATVGVLEVSPNSPNVIPGVATLVTDLRSADPALLAALARGGAEGARQAAATEGVRAEVAVVLDQAPVTFDPGLRGVMREIVTGLGGDGRELASGAGHDAVHMQALAPSGMLFVRCAGGLSHRPDESVTREDATLAAEALLRTALAVDGRAGQ